MIFSPQVHAGDRSWVCDYPGCTKQFISKGALKIHKSKHLRENGLAAPTDAQCIQCGKIFGSRQVKYLDLVISRNLFAVNRMK